jgi:hypothetical protein
MNYNYLANYGKPPEREEAPPLTEEEKKGRWLKTLGAFAVLFVVGLLVWFFLYGPTPLELKARKYALPDRQFVDQNARIDLPPSWMMLKRDNPFFHNVTSGQMFAIHPGSGCTAVFLIGPNTGAHPDYLLDTVKDRFVGWDRINERDRESVQISGREARRATFDLWRRNAIREVAYVTTVSDEVRYYLLLGYTPLDGGNVAFSAFKELEKSFQLGPAPVAPQAPAAQ